MSLTEINESNITPHLKKFVDDIISMTSKIILKRSDVASSYENRSSVILSEYYIQMLEGNDTLRNYDIIPYEVYESLLSWKRVGYEAYGNFPSSIKYGETLIPMKNKINVCYIGDDDPTTEAYKNIGNKYDGYIKITSSSMEKLRLYDNTSIGYMLINDESKIDYTNSTTDGSKINFEDIYCRIGGSFVPITSINNRYVLENDDYVFSEIGTYVYNVEYEMYLKNNRFNDQQILRFMQNRELIYEDRNGLADDLLVAMRNYVINTYVEPDRSPESEFSIMRYFGESNTYYRQLNGLPPLDQMNTQPNILMDDFVPEVYAGTNTIKKLYDLNDDDVEAIKANGNYDRLFELYQSIDYVKYMGSDRIDVADARVADRFDILRIGDYEYDYHYDIFISNFQTARDYILRRFYNPEIFYANEYYGSYIAYLIVCQAAFQSIAHNDSILLNYLYSDENTVRLRLQSYGLNVFDDIPLIYRKNISKYIENLIRNKGTDMIYSLIMDIFNVDSLEVYKYFFRRLKDENGNILLSMAQVPIEAENFISEIIKDINQISYDEITENDIYWGSYGMPLHYTNEQTGEIIPVNDPDEFLKNIITNTQFNYMNSKYISINGVFNLSKLNFNASYLMNYLLELSKRNLDITMIADGIDGSHSLFILMVMLFAIQAKRLRYDGNIQHDAVSVAYVLKYNLDDYIIKDGEKIKISDLYKKYYTEYYYEYLIEKYSNQTISRLIREENNAGEIISKYKAAIDGVSKDPNYPNHTEEENSELVKLKIPSVVTIDSITETYLFNSGLDGAYDNILNLREEAKTYKEYECYNELLKAIAVSKLNNEIFKLSEPEWIEIDNFVTWIEVIDDDIKQMVYNDYINNNDTDYVLCKSNGYPDLSLGYEYSDDVTQYCIDRTTVKNSYNSSVKIYKKDYIVSDTIDSLDTRLVGNNNILYVVESTGNIYEQLVVIDLNVYDNPYCYDKTTGKIYKYLKYARTYEEYLRHENEDLYDLLQPTESDYTTDEETGERVLQESYYDHLSELYINIVSAIENLIKDEDLKNIINSSFIDLNLLTDYIRKVITVFKSFEIDIATINIIYELNDPNKYRIKILDGLSSHSDENYYEHFHIIQDLAFDESSVCDDAVIIRDELNIEENTGGI